MSRIRPIILGLLGLALAAGCGPRADDPQGGADLGAPPVIFTTKSVIPTPDGTLEGPDVTFPVRFVVQAQDQDANMRWVEIEVSYTDTCDGELQRWFLTEGLPPDDWVKVDIDVDESTTDEVRVPVACYPANNLFDMRLRVRDFRGNLSNLLRNQVQASYSQGPGG
jgi:hypothetical protein